MRHSTRWRTRAEASLAGALPTPIFFYGGDYITAHRLSTADNCDDGTGENKDRTQHAEHRIGNLQIHRPVKRLAVHYANQDQAHKTACNQTHDDSEPSKTAALHRKDPRDLPASQPDVPQHAELTSTHQYLRARARSDSKQTDDDCDEFQQIGDRKRAIESLQRQTSELARRAHVVFKA